MGPGNLHFHSAPSTKIEILLSFEGKEVLEEREIIVKVLHASASQLINFWLENTKFLVHIAPGFCLSTHRETGMVHNLKRFYNVSLIPPSLPLEKLGIPPS